MHLLSPLRTRLSLSVSNSTLAPTRFIKCRKTSTRVDQRLSLQDGRVLGYSEYGRPNGFPILYFHGYPSSRLEAWCLDDLAQRRGLRLIAADRPGFGLSTFQPRRRIIDWPADVQALAQHLNLPRVAVLGCSGGGPYAVACAYTLPHQMLSGVGVLAGAGPWAAGTQDVSLPRRLTSQIAVKWPRGMERTTNKIIPSLQWAMGTKPATKLFDRWIEKFNTGDKGGLSTQQTREYLIKLGFEALVQGAEGFVQETQLLGQDWGFRFEDVTYDKIQIWHGTQDKNTPIRLTRHMAERLPHCVLREFKDDSHYTIGNHFEDVFSDFVSDDMVKEHARKFS